MTSGVVEYFVSNIMLAFFRILPLIVMAVALVRVALLVFHSPMIGYANQYDMARTSACIGLWPKQEHRVEAHPQSPVRIYVPGPEQKDVCYPGTDVVIAGIAKSGWTMAAMLDLAHSVEFDLRWVGATRVVLLLVASLLIGWALVGRPWIGTLHALSLLAVFSDPISTLFFNTLYTEFSAMFGCYLMFGALLIGSDDRPTAWRYRRQSLLVAGLLCLLFSRTQHLWLPLILCAPLAALEWRASASRRFVSMGVCIAILALAYGIRLGAQGESGGAGLSKANTVNTVFLAHLPAYPDTRGALRTMGLDPACETLVFTSWFRLRGRDIDSTCPAVFAMPRSTLLVALLKEPAALIRLAALSLHASSGWRMGSVGEVEGAIDARIDSGGVFLGASASRLVEGLSFGQYVFFWVLPLIGGVVSGAILMVRRTGSRRSPIDGDFVPTCLRSLVFALIIIAYAWASSLFGDGTSEFGRHLHLGQLFAMVAWLVMGLLLVHCIVEQAARRRSSSRGRVIGSPTAAWLFALSLPLAILATVVLARTPSTVGSIDILDRHVFAADQRLGFSGWARDPYGIQDIALSFRGRRYPVVDMRPAQDVDRWFPVDSRHPASAFSAAVDLGPATERDMLLELIVTNRRGVTRVVDAIWLEVR
jgi:hypothetical protein